MSIPHTISQAKARQRMQHFLLRRQSILNDAYPFLVSLDKRLLSLYVLLFYCLHEYLSLFMHLAIFTYTATLRQLPYLIKPPSHLGDEKESMGVHGPFLVKRRVNYRFRPLPTYLGLSLLLCFGVYAAYVLCNQNFQHYTSGVSCRKCESDTKMVHFALLVILLRNCQKKKPISSPGKSYKEKVGYSMGIRGESCTCVHNTLRVYLQLSNKTMTLGQKCVPWCTTSLLYHQHMLLTFAYTPISHNTTLALRFKDALEHFCHM